MFSTIKTYIVAFTGIIFVALLAYVKYLRSSKRKQEEQINTLEKNAEIVKELNKDEIKRTKFNEKQKVKSEKFKNSEQELDKIEKDTKFSEDKNFKEVSI